MENFKQIKKSSDERLKIMFEDVNKIIKKYGLQDYLQEQPDGSKILDQGYSPFLPKEAFITDEHYPNDVEVYLENLKNFRWGVNDNILKDVKNYFIEDTESIENLKSMVDELDAVIDVIEENYIIKSNENSQKDKDNYELEL